MEIIYGFYTPENPNIHVLRREIEQVKFWAAILVLSKSRFRLNNGFYTPENPNMHILHKEIEQT